MSTFPGFKGFYLGSGPYLIDDMSQAGDVGRLESLTRTIPKFREPGGQFSSNRRVYWSNPTLIGQPESVNDRLEWSAAFGGLLYPAWNNNIYKEFRPGLMTNYINPTAGTIYLSGIADGTTEILIALDNNGDFAGFNLTFNGYHTLSFSSQNIRLTKQTYLLGPETVVLDEAISLSTTNTAYRLIIENYLGVPGYPDGYQRFRILELENNTVIYSFIINEIMLFSGTSYLSLDHAYIISIKQFMGEKYPFGPEMKIRATIDPPTLTDWQSSDLKKNIFLKYPNTFTYGRASVGRNSAIYFGGGNTFGSQVLDLNNNNPSPYSIMEHGSALLGMRSDGNLLYLDGVYLDAEDSFTKINLAYVLYAAFGGLALDRDWGQDYLKLGLPVGRYSVAISSFTLFSYSTNQLRGFQKSLVSIYKLSEQVEITALSGISHSSLNGIARHSKNGLIKTYIVQGGEFSTSEYQNPSLQVSLSSKSKFLVGTSTGLQHYPTFAQFGIPPLYSSFPRLHCFAAAQGPATGGWKIGSI